MLRLLSNSIESSEDVDPPEAKSVVAVKLRSVFGDCLSSDELLFLVRLAFLSCVFRCDFSECGVVKALRHSWSVLLHL